MPERWIVIPNWAGFQHYKDRTPKWIKNYTELLDDDAYLTLTYAQRGVLHGLWMTYASSRQRLPGDTRELSRRLGGQVREETLQALSHAGFIRFSASAPLAKPERPASPDKSREETPKSPSGNGRGYVCGIDGCTVTHPTEQRIAEHRENVHDVAPDDTPALELVTTAEPAYDPTPIRGTHDRHPRPARRPDRTRRSPP